MKTGTVYEQARTGLETIFVAVGPADRDRNERLADEAIDLAAPSGAGVVLGHVFTEEEYVERRDALGFDADSEVTPDIVAERIAAVRDLGEALDAADVEYEVRGALGDSGEGIVDLADAEAADLVLVGGRTRSPTGKAVFGSTAQEVMLSASCPVLFVRADTR